MPELDVRNKMNKPLSIVSLVVAFIALGCSNSSSPEQAVSDFFELSKKAEDLEKVRGLIAGEALENHDRSFFENYDVTHSILDKAEQEDGTVRLKVKINYSDKERESNGHQTEVLTLSMIQDEWKIIKVGGPFKDFGLDELKDSKSRTPFDYADEYFDAMNQEDLARMQSLHTKEHYEYITTGRGFLEESDPSRLEDKIKKTESYEVNEKETEFVDSNPSGVFKAAYKITLTDEFAKEFGDKHLGGKFFKGPAGFTLYFKLDDGIWRITNHEGI